MKFLVSMIGVDQIQMFICVIKITLLKLSYIKKICFGKISVKARSKRDYLKLIHFALYFNTFMVMIQFIKWTIS